MLGAAVAVGVVFALRPSPPPAADPMAEVGASRDEGDGYAVWARRPDGDPVRWDPCSPIRLVVSDAGAPAAYPLEAMVLDVEEAAATLRDASGLDVVVVATSDEEPDGARPTTVIESDGDRRWAPILIGWREPGAGGLPLRDVDRGIAVPIAVGPGQGRTYVTGQIALNPARTDLRPGTDDRATSWGATVLHELAHVLGLDHVDDPDELMHRYPGQGPVRLGPGDLAGLRAVGADGGCLDVPEPVELDVDLPTP